MKKTNISKIAALRKCLTRFAYGKEAMGIIAEDYLGENLKFEMADIINPRGHAAVMFTIYDENDECRQFSAEICAEEEEFTFKGIGLEENLYHCNARLVTTVNSKSRIKNKHAWIVNYNNDGGFYTVLVSYVTVIAVWKADTNVIYLQRNARNYSNTTRRHLSDFERYVKAFNETAVLKWANWE